MEVLVATVVIITIMLGVTMLNNASMRNTTRAKYRLQIALFAQEQMEILRNMRDTGIIVGPEITSTNKSGWDRYFTEAKPSNPFLTDFCIPATAVGGGVEKFQVWYNFSENQYRIQTMEGFPQFDDNKGIPINAQNEPKFTFWYYLECVAVSDVKAVLADDSELEVPITSLEHQPRRFRIVTTWSEYGQERKYYLNNYLTNLGYEL